MSTLGSLFNDSADLTFSTRHPQTSQRRQKINFESPYFQFGKVSISTLEPQQGKTKRNQRGTPTKVLKFFRAVNGETE